MEFRVKLFHSVGGIMNFDLTMAEAKKQFSLGSMTGYFIEFIFGAYQVHFHMVVGKRPVDAVLVDARTKSPRQFKSLDGAASALEQIGFKISRFVGQ